MNKEKPYSFTFNGREYKFSLEEFRCITKYNSGQYNTTENITLTIIDYAYEQNVLIANTNLEKVPIFNDSGDYYYSGIVAFDPFVSGAIWLEDEEYYAKEKALSCIGHTFKIPTITSHEWREYKGEKILDYSPSYEDIIKTSWEGRLTNYCCLKGRIIEEKFGGLNNDK